MHYVAAAADLQMAREEYDKFDFCVRKLLWQRAVLLSGQEWADSALAARDNFVQVCLLGQRPGSHAGPPSVEQAAQVCITQRELGCRWGHPVKASFLGLDIFSNSTTFFPN